MDEENPDDTVDVDQSTEDDDDIMNNVNSDVLGDNVIESSTEENDQEEAPAEDSADSSETEIPDATEELQQMKRESRRQQRRIRILLRSPLISQRLQVQKRMLPRLTLPYSAKRIRHTTTSSNSL